MEEKEDQDDDDEKNAAHALCTSLNDQWLPDGLSLFALLAFLFKADQWFREERAVWKPWYIRVVDAAASSSSPFFVVAIHRTRGGCRVGVHSTAAPAMSGGVRGFDFDFSR